MIRRLARVVPAAPGKPSRPEARASQDASRGLAEDPGSWSGAQAREVIRRYTELAPVWDGERGGYRPVPLAGALRRGGPWLAGRCVEIGSGTGLLTPLLRAVWPEIVCLDLTAEMLRRARAPWRVVADAARLPVARAWDAVTAEAGWGRWAVPRGA